MAVNPKGTRAIIYTRISKDREGSHLGVDRQRADCAELAQQRGFTVVAVLEDNDMSASSGKPRPGYERLLAAIEAGECNAVLAWHPDRLHRRPVELERFIDICEPREVMTFTVRGGQLDLSTPSGQFVARQLGSAARYEVQQASARVRRAKMQAKADGKWMGGLRWFGFAERSTTEENPREAAAIREAAAEIVAGGTLIAIARRWNADGLTTSRGNQWTTTQVRGVLQAERMERLIDPDIRLALLAKLADPSRRWGQSHSLKLAGSNFYLCGECGTQLGCAGTGGTGGYRYGCRRVEKSCLYRNAAPIDAAVFDAAIERLTDQGIALLPRSDDAAPLRAELDKLQARHDSIAHLLADGEMDAGQFKIANGNVEHRMQQLEAEIGRISAGSVLLGVADAEDQEEAFRACSLERKRSILQVLMEVTVYSAPRRKAFSLDTIRIRFHSLDQVRGE